MQRIQNRVVEDVNTPGTVLLLFDFSPISLLLSGTVHTKVEVRRMDSEMSRLVEQPWLQLMCCTICLPHSHNFR